MLVVCLTVAVVIVFFLCWAPFHAQRLLFTYGTVSDNWQNETLRLVNERLFYVAGQLTVITRVNVNRAGDI